MKPPPSLVHRTNHPAEGRHRGLTRDTQTDEQTDTQTTSVPSNISRPTPLQHGRGTTLAKFCKAATGEVGKHTSDRASRPIM